VTNIKKLIELLLQPLELAVPFDTYDNVLLDFNEILDLKLTQDMLYKIIEHIKENRKDFNNTVNFLQLQTFFDIIIENLSSKNTATVADVIGLFLTPPKFALIQNPNRFVALVDDLYTFYLERGEIYYESWLTDILELPQFFELCFAKGSSGIIMYTQYYERLHPYHWLHKDYVEKILTYYEEHFDELVDLLRKEDDGWTHVMKKLARTDTMEWFIDKIKERNDFSVKSFLQYLHKHTDENLPLCYGVFYALFKGTISFDTAEEFIKGDNVPPAYIRDILKKHLKSFLLSTGTPEEAIIRLYRIYLLLRQMSYKEETINYLLSAGMGFEIKLPKREDEISKVLFQYVIKYKLYHETAHLSDEIVL
jgi:hypothetical protein